MEFIPMAAAQASSSRTSPSGNVPACQKASWLIVERGL